MDANEWPSANWQERKAKYARGLNNIELWYAMADCRKAIKAKCNESKYLDELAIYAQEFNRRRA